MITDELAPIIGVAIKHGDLVITLPAPNRHNHVMDYMKQTLHLWPPFDGEQGFYTNDGIFLNRSEAFEYAQRTKQCTRREHAGPFTSEELW